jgi:tyrosyl-tRNA synthetase
MSKSKPWTAIFIHDSPDEIRLKLRKAWCPERAVDMNPVLEIAKHVVFHESETFKIERPAKFGGSVTFENYEELEKAYAEGTLHPMDLKSGVAEALAVTLEPVRRYFENDKAAKECMEVVQNLKVTR